MRGNISTDLEHRELIRIDSLVSEVRSNLYRFCKEFKVNIIFEHNMQLIEKKYLKSLYIYSIKINNKLSSAREVLKNLYGNIIEGYDDIVLENILSVYEEKLNLTFQKEVLNGNLKDDYFNLYKNIYYKNSVDFQISFQIIDTETILSLYKLEKSKFNEVCRECELNRINVFNEETNIFYLRKEVEFVLGELKYADFYNECSRRFYDGKWVSGNRALELLMLGNETRKRNKEFCQYLKKSEVAINRRKLERKAYDIYYDDYSEEVYSMMDISAFWNEHLFSGIFAKKIKITNNEFVNLCDELLIEKVYLCNDEKFYIRKEDFEESIKENFISKKEVIDKYCAGKEVNLYKINNRYNDRHDTSIYYKKNIESKVNEINKKYNELKSHKEWITIDEIRMLFRIAFGDFEKNINFLSCDWIKLEGEIKIREVEYTNSIGFEITFYNRRDIECIIERMKPINIINDEKKVSIKRIEEVEKRYEIKKLMLGKGKESTLYDVQQIMNAIKEIDQQYYKLMSNDEWITENDIKELFKVAYGDIGDDINFTDEVKIVFKNEMKIQEVEYTQSEEFKAIFYNRNDLESFIERMKPINIINNEKKVSIKRIEEVEKRYEIKKLMLGKGRESTLYDVNQVMNAINEIDQQYYKLMSDDEWITENDIRELFKVAYGDIGDDINFTDEVKIVFKNEMKIQEVEYTQSEEFKAIFYNRNDLENFIERMKPISLIEDGSNRIKRLISIIEKRYDLEKVKLGKSKYNIFYNVKQIKNAIKEIDHQYYKLMSDNEWITENHMRELLKIAYGDIVDEKKFTDEVKKIFKNEMKIQEVEYTQSEEFKVIFYNRNDIENFIERMKPISLIEDGSDQIKRLISIIEKRYDLEKVKLGKSKYNIFYNVKQIKNAIKEIDHQYYKLMSDSEWITENDMRELFRIAYGDIADGMNFAGKCGVVLEENITIQKVENTQSEKFNTIFYNKSDAEKFVNSLISREQLFMAICKSNRRLIEFEKKHALKVFKLGKFNSLQFYSEKEFDSKFEEYDRGKYCSIEEFAKEYFDKGDKYLKSFIPNLKKSLFKVKHLISMKKLEKPYVDLKNNIIVEEVYLRSEIELFFEKYIKVTEAYNLFNKEVNEEIHKVTFTTYKNRLNIECVILGNNTDEYMLKSDFQRIINEYSLKTKSYLEYIQNNNYYVQTEVRKKLNISEKHLYKLLEEEVLEIKEVYNTINLYDKGEIDYLKKYQDEQISYFKNKYMSNSELVLKYNERFARYITTYNRNHREKIKELNIPRIVRGFYKANDIHLYNKDVVQEIYEKYEVDNKLKSIMYEDKFEEFKYKVEEIVKVEFKSLQQKTKRLWYEFVEKRLIEIKKGENITTIVNQYVRNTNYIFSIFKKEIFMYKEIEINDLYMNENSNIEKTYQKQFLTFLRVINNTFMHEKNEIIFNIKEINDPYSYNKMRKHDESIYTYSEYEQLYSYCNNIDYHKKKAIEDVEDYLESGRYKRYDSTWLYVLFHLFNSLRSKSIITQIPRIDLSSTSIKNLEWLKYNNPTIEDANIIINQINRYVHHIGKTGVDAKAKFQIGEPMKVAFAIAISICEFRQREINSMDNKLIDLNKSLDSKSSMYKFFFSEFESDLVFASRKMNRTLETFISIITDYYTNGGNGIKAAQIARGHLNKETTKIYIKLSESEVEKLTLQLFERKSFGFVTKIFSELLFEGSKINEDKNIKVINQFFGGVDKIEVTSGVINKISSEQEKVREYLKSFSLEEINNLWLSSIVGVLPTHQEYYQCIYKECIHVDEYGKKAKMCENCESAICNVYALTTLMNLYIDTLDYLVNNFYEESEGEKRRLANHFYLLHKRVSEARQMFGKEVVNGFIDGGSLKVESITSKLKEKDLRKYKTIEY